MLMLPDVIMLLRWTCVFSACRDMPLLCYPVALCYFVGLVSSLRAMTCYLMGGILPP